MSKVILYIAVSLDGFIARRDGRLDWLDALPNPDQIDHGYAAFLSGIDRIIMGRKTYDVILGFGIDWPYTGIQTYVVSADRNLKIETPDTELLCDNAIERIKRMKMDFGKDIWLVGGGKLVTLFLNNNLIDQMVLSVIPNILGEGIPLFPDNPLESVWNLSDSISYPTGVVSLTYNNQLIS